jgi:hypothetical protein
MGYNKEGFDKNGYDKCAPPAHSTPGFTAGRPLLNALACCCNSKATQGVSQGFVHADVSCQTHFCCLAAALNREGYDNKGYDRFGFDR